MSAQLRPVVGPVIAQVAAAHAGKFLDGAALVGRHPARLPIQDGLDVVFVQGVGKRLRSARFVDRSFKPGLLVHGTDGKRIVDASQQGVSVRLETVPMDTNTPVWNRVLEWVAAEHCGGKSTDAPRWLYTALGYSKQRMANWGERDIPAREYANVAAAIGKSIAWVTTGFDGEIRPPRDPAPAVAQMFALFARLNDAQRARVIAFAEDMLEKRAAPHATSSGTAGAVPKTPAGISLPPRNPPGPHLSPIAIAKAAAAKKRKL